MQRCLLKTILAGRYSLAEDKRDGSSRHSGRTDVDHHLTSCFGVPGPAQTVFERCGHWSSGSERWSRVVLSRSSSDRVRPTGVVDDFDSGVGNQVGLRHAVWRFVRHTMKSPPVRALRARFVPRSVVLFLQFASKLRIFISVLRARATATATLYQDLVRSAHVDLGRAATSWTLDSLNMTERLRNLRAGPSWFGVTSSVSACSLRRGFAICPEALRLRIANLRRLRRRQAQRPGAACWRSSTPRSDMYGRG